MFKVLVKLIAGLLVECLRLQPGGQEGLPHLSGHCSEGGQATAQEDRGHQGVAGRGQGARAGQETEQGLQGLVQGNERGLNLLDPIGSQYIRAISVTMFICISPHVENQI